VGDLVEVIGGQEHRGRMGFVECMDYEPDITIVELQGKLVWYFLQEKLLSIDSLCS
jgi:hypothetical protein